MAAKYIYISVEHCVVLTCVALVDSLDRLVTKPSDCLSPTSTFLSNAARLSSEFLTLTGGN